MLFNVMGKKQGQLLLSARELFWKYGFRKVSIEELCKHAGVSKMTFYRFYPDKITIAKAVFDIVVTEGMEQFQDIMNSSAPPSEKIKSILLLKLNSVNDISREFLMDFYHNPQPGLTGFIETKSKELRDNMIHGFREAQEKGDFRKDLKPEAMIAILQKLRELLTDEELIALYPSSREWLTEIAVFFANGSTSHA